jgi:hypothetical protein
VLVLSVHALFVWERCPHHPSPLELDSSSTQKVGKGVAPKLASLISNRFWTSSCYDDSDQFQLYIDVGLVGLERLSSYLSIGI